MATRKSQDTSEFLVNVLLPRAGWSERHAACSVVRKTAGWVTGVIVGELVVLVALLGWLALGQPGLAALSAW